MTWTGASDAAIAARMPRCCWSMIPKSGSKSSKKPSWNMVCRVFLETQSPQWLVKLKAARAGPRSDASLCLSVMNVAMAGPT